MPKGKVYELKSPRQKQKYTIIRNNLIFSSIFCMQLSINVIPLEEKGVPPQQIDPRILSKIFDPRKA